MDKLLTSTVLTDPVNPETVKVTSLGVPAVGLQPAAPSGIAPKVAGSALNVADGAAACPKANTDDNATVAASAK